MTFPIFPEQASTVARQVDGLFFFLTAVSVVILLIVFVPMIYFLFKYRRGKEVDRTMPRIPVNTIEVTWTLIPLFLGVGMFVWGTTIYVEMRRPPVDALDINVIAKQWMWKLHHPEGNREINELHVPVGQPVRLVMVSQDVIHSFFIPAFRVKQDVLPDRYTTEWFTVTKPGVYHFFCAEYCGTEHSLMKGRVVALEPAQYEAWLREGERKEALALAGERLFRELGCSGCHSPQSQIPAPQLEGLYGKPVPLASGEFARADAQYIRDSILKPMKEIAAGYAPVMPSFEGQVTEEDLLKLVAYIQSLGGNDESSDSL